MELSITKQEQGGGALFCQKIATNTSVVNAGEVRLADYTTIRICYFNADVLHFFGLQNFGGDTELQIVIPNEQKKSWDAISSLWPMLGGRVVKMTSKDSKDYVHDLGPLFSKMPMDFLLHSNIRHLEGKGIPMNEQIFRWLHPPTNYHRAMNGIRFMVPHNIITEEAKIRQSDLEGFLLSCYRPHLHIPYIVDLGPAYLDENIEPFKFKKSGQKLELESVDPEEDDQWYLTKGPANWDADEWENRKVDTPDVTQSILIEFNDAMIDGI